MHRATVRPPRIAFVVYNDVHRDTRVRRIAKAAVDAGAEVRVFAFGGVAREPVRSRRRARRCRVRDRTSADRVDRPRARRRRAERQADAASQAGCDTPAGREFERRGHLRRAGARRAVRCRTDACNDGRPGRKRRRRRPATRREGLGDHAMASGRQDGSAVLLLAQRATCSAAVGTGPRPCARREHAARGDPRRPATAHPLRLRLARTVDPPQRESRSPRCQTTRGSDGTARRPPRGRRGHGLAQHRRVAVAQLLAA